MRNVSSPPPRVNRLGRCLAKAFGLVLLLSGCQSDAPGQCKLDLTAVLPLADVHAHFSTPIVLDGVRLNMIFDTGAAMTVLTTNTTNRLTLKLDPAGYATGIGGSASDYVFVANRFQLSNLRGRGLGLMASDINLSSSDHEVDGLLGDNFVATYDVDLDLAEHKVRLYTALSGCRTPSAALNEDLYGVKLAPINAFNSRPMVEVEVGGATLSALIDTGATHSAIFRDAARQLGLDAAALHADPRFHIHGIGPRSPQAVRHVMTPMVIGDLTLLNFPVEIVDQQSSDGAQMILGLDFLSRVHVWLSFSSKTMIMQYPPRPSPTIPADRL